MASDNPAVLSGTKSATHLTLPEKLVIGALVGLCIGLVSALVQHHATALVTAQRKN